MVFMVCSLRREVRDIGIDVKVMVGNALAILKWGMRDGASGK
jgi:hypothetical protein